MTTISDARYSFVMVNQSRACLSCGHIVSAKAPCRFCGAKPATDLPRIVCQYCRCEAKKGDQSCSNCGESLGGSCEACGSSVAPEWRVCPICGTLRVEIKGSTTVPAKRSMTRILFKILLVLLLLGSWAVAGFLYWERGADRQVWVGQSPDSVEESITLPGKPRISHRVRR